MLGYSPRNNLPLVMRLAIDIVQRNFEVFSLCLRIEHQAVFFGLPYHPTQRDVGKLRLRIATANNRNARQQTKPARPVDCLRATTLFGQPATDPGLSQAECRLYDRYSPDKYSRVDCSLGATVVVTFSHLTEWTTKENDPQKLLLILIGRVMKGVTPIGPATQHPDELRFDRKRMDLVQGDPDSQANRDAWTALLSRAQRRQVLNVGVALAGNPPYYGTVPLLPAFDVFPQYWPVIVLFFLALLWAFLLLAHNSDIVRDAPSGDGGTKQPWYSLRTAPGATRKFSFSLARCQMAVWTVVLGFVFVVAVYNTLAMPDFSATLLGLTGISAGTYVGFKIPDRPK
jgi:hypothetical protein